MLLEKTNTSTNRRRIDMKYKLTITGTGDKYDIEAVLEDMLDIIKWMAANEGSFSYRSDAEHGNFTMELIEVTEEE